MIYTVFTLSSPDDEFDVRYVGVTSQHHVKRVCDMVSVSKQEYCNGHMSFMSKWLRELAKDGKSPIITVELQTEDVTEAKYCRISTFNCFYPTGRLLNSRFRRDTGVALETQITTKIPGPSRPWLR